MAGESQQLPSSAPDPSVLTTEAVTRAARAERDYVDGQIAVLSERLDGIDKATVVLNEIVTRVPTETQREVGRLEQLTRELFRSVDQRFTERDARAQREAELSATAVAAALEAQKSAAEQQTKFSQLAIDKSERSTAETIQKLAQLFSTEGRGLAEKIDDVKNLIGGLDRRLTSVEQQKVGGREANASMYALGGFILVLLTIAGTIFALRP